MSFTTALRRRTLFRGAAVGLVLAGYGLLGTPAALAAPDDGRPVIALDPPDVGVFMIPQELGGFGPAEMAAAAGVEGGAAEALTDAAAALPPSAAAALGVPGGFSAEADAPIEAVDVQYGGTVEMQLPPLIDTTTIRFTLDVLPPDPDDLPRRYRTTPAASNQPLTMTPLGGNAFAVTLPAASPGYGPSATLTVDRVTVAATGAELLFPLSYDLRFTGTGTGTVALEPTLGVFAHAVCSFEGMEACPAPSVRAGDPVDLTVPAGSLLTTLGFGRLDSAFYLLESMDDVEPYESYDSETNPDMVAVHGPSRATLRVPAAARPGPYYGLVVEGDPSTGFAVTSYELDVAADPVNPGLRSDTGWVDEVREVSPGSTAAVAGGALLLVGGLVTAVAVRPTRRPPLGG